MEHIEFQQPKNKQQYEARLAALKQIIQSPAVTTQVLWDATAAKYAHTIDKVNALLHQSELADEINPRLEQQIQAFLKKCANPEFHIAIVGAIKAGKSSLINAILDEKLASTEVTPETAALTKFRGSNVEDGVSITFYRKEEWENLWKSANMYPNSKFMEEYQKLNAANEEKNWIGHTPLHMSFQTRDELKKEIEKWTSSRSATHYFVKEVEVSLLHTQLPEGVVLVDTPGLNDVVEYRSEITKNYIDRANAVFVCVKADKLSGPELATIYGVFSNARYQPEKIYVIATQQDSLNQPREDWGKQSKVWLEYLKEPTCYGSPLLAQKNLLATSGHFYTLLKNKNLLSEDDLFQLWSSAMKLRCNPKDIDQKYEELLDFTGIDILNRRMQDDIISKHKSLLMEDIQGHYTIIKGEISLLMDKVRSRQKEVIASSTASIEEIEKKAQENAKRLEEARAEQKELDESFAQIRAFSEKIKRETTDAIRRLGTKI